MNDLKARYGAWALVAGAAEGLGEAYSTLVAKNGMNLVMADHNRPAMESLAATLQAAYGITVRTLEVDLAGGEAWERCIGAIGDLDCRLLIYNAAYSHVTSFLNYSHPELNRFVGVNALTEIHLVHAFASLLRERGKPGGILLMSSLSGVIALPLVAPYAATKGFANKLAESLFSELKPLGIRISACTAGIILTPKFWESRPIFGSYKPPVMEAEAVARYALRHLGRRPVITPGWKNRLSYFFLIRILPKAWSLRIVARVMRKMYPSGSAEQ